MIPLVCSVAGAVLGVGIALLWRDRGDYDFSALWRLPLFAVVGALVGVVVGAIIG